MNIEVNIAELVVTKDADNLVVHGIGSCLVITLHDPRLKVGGLAHAMLPTDSRPKGQLHAEECDLSLNAKYVDTAIDKMIKKMLAYGVKKQDIEAKIIGGANMFSMSDSSDIGMQNVISAKEKLEKEGINLVAESVGGSIGRSVEFSVAAGTVTVKMKF